MRLRPSPWEVRLIRMLDARQLEIFAATPADGAVAPNDVRGMADLMAGLRTRANAFFDKEKQ